MAMLLLLLLLLDGGEQPGVVRRGGHHGRAVLPVLPMLPPVQRAGRALAEVARGQVRVVLRPRVVGRQPVAVGRPGVVARVAGGRGLENLFGFWHSWAG